MKHFRLFTIFTIFLFSICFCQTPNTEVVNEPSNAPVEDSFYTESYQVPLTDIYEITAKYDSSNATFDDLRQMRQELKEKSVAFIGSSSNNSEETVLKGLTGLGNSTNDAKVMLQKAKSRGNIILFYNVANSTTNGAYLYFEKE